MEHYDRALEKSSSTWYVRRALQYIVYIVILSCQHYDQCYRALLIQHDNIVQHQYTETRRGGGRPGYTPTERRKERSIRQGQRTNGPINQRTNQGTNQPTDQPTNGQTNQWTNQQTNQAVNQPVNQPTDQAGSQSTKKPGNPASPAARQHYRKL